MKKEEINSMKLATYIFLIFFNIINFANAIKLVENNSYSGTIKDNYRNNIPLPPGSWDLTEIDLDQEYVTYYFSNSEIGYVTHFGPKGSPAYDIWTGNVTPSMCKGSTIVKKVNISGKNNFEWCAIHDGDYIQFLNHSAQYFSQYYHSYWIKKNLLKNTSKNNIQTIGSQIFEQVKKNKAGDLSFLSSLISFNQLSDNSNSYSSYDSSESYTALYNTDKFKMNQTLLVAEKLFGSKYSDDYKKVANEYFPLKDEYGSIFVSLNPRTNRVDYWWWSTRNTLAKAQENSRKKCNEGSKYGCVEFIINDDIVYSGPIESMILVNGF